MRSPRESDTKRRIKRMPVRRMQNYWIDRAMRKKLYNGFVPRGEFGLDSGMDVYARFEKSAP